MESKTLFRLSISEQNENGSSGAFSLNAHLHEVTTAAPSERKPESCTPCGTVWSSTSERGPLFTAVALYVHILNGWGAAGWRRISFMKNSHLANYISI